jgi:hypothetical protein
MRLVSGKWQHQKNFRSQTQLIGCPWCPAGTGKTSSDWCTEDPYVILMWSQVDIVNDWWVSFSLVLIEVDIQFTKVQEQMRARQKWVLCVWGTPCSPRATRQWNGGGDDQGTSGNSWNSLFHLPFLPQPLPTFSSPPLHATSNPPPTSVMPPFTTPPSPSSPSLLWLSAHWHPSTRPPALFYHFQSEIQ